MIETVEVLFTPADFEALSGQDLSESGCVVFDILRATSSILTALGNGASAVIPVADIPEALAVRQQRPDVLLAGERNGVRIRAAQTGGVNFDLGNSPREYVADRVAGRAIVSTTTNGTRALRACAGAREILVGALLNLRATAARVEELEPRRLIVVCSGTFEQTAFEDVLAAGALVELLAPRLSNARWSDAVLIAARIYRDHAGDLAAALRLARNGRQLLSIPDLRDDVDFCARLDTIPRPAALFPDGQIKFLPDRKALGS